MLLEEMSWDIVEEILGTVKTIILPYGSCEAHGFHAPLFTDTKIAFEIARKAAEELNIFVAPVIPYALYLYSITVWRQCSFNMDQWKQRNCIYWC